MTPENKRKLIGGSLIGLSVLMYIRYGKQPRVTSDSVDFDNLPTKALCAIVGLTGLWVLLQKTSKQ